MPHGGGLQGCRDPGGVCADIFSAIEKGKTQAYSCVIVDWADQPEASFLCGALVSP